VDRWTIHLQKSIFLRQIFNLEIDSFRDRGSITIQVLGLKYQNLRVRDPHLRVSSRTATKFYSSKPFTPRPAALIAWFPRPWRRTRIASRLAPRQFLPHDAPCQVRPKTLAPLPKFSSTIDLFKFARCHFHARAHKPPAWPNAKGHSHFYICPQILSYLHTVLPSSIHSLQALFSDQWRQENST